VYFSRNVLVNTIGPIWEGRIRRRAVSSNGTKQIYVQISFNTGISFKWKEFSDLKDFASAGR